MIPSPLELPTFACASVQGVCNNDGRTQANWTLITRSGNVAIAHACDTNAFCRAETSLSFSFVVHTFLNHVALYFHGTRHTFHDSFHLCMLAKVPKFSRLCLVGRVQFEPLAVCSNAACHLRMFFSHACLSLSLHLALGLACVHAACMHDHHHL